MLTIDEFAYHYPDVPVEKLQEAYTAYLQGVDDAEREECEKWDGLKS